MAISDFQERVARQYGKAIFKRMQAGSTLGQAVNQAVTDVNPKGDLKITAAIIASLVGVDLEERVEARRLRDGREDPFPDMQAEVTETEPYVPQPDVDH